MNSKIKNLRKKFAAAINETQLLRTFISHQRWFLLLLKKKIFIFISRLKSLNSKHEI